MNELIENIYETGYVKDGQGRDLYALRSAIPFDQGMAIYNLIKQTKVTKTLEVGMGYGLSALFASQAHAENNLQGVHTAIDPKQSTIFESIGLLNIQRAGLGQHIRFFEASSHEILPKLLDSGEQFGFIFIDGMHVFDFTLVDFFFSDLLLVTNGFLMFDDLWMPSVRKVVNFVIRNRHYQLDSDWIWNPRPLAYRVCNFLRTSIYLKTFVRHQFSQPFDFSAIYFGLRGSVKYQVLVKMADDDRVWDYHRIF